MNEEEISEEKKKELYELVEKQKKANISWIGTITQLSVEEIKTIAWDIGLVIDNDLIMLPTETNEGKKAISFQKNHEKMIQLAINERVLREYTGGGREREFPINQVLTSSDSLDALAIAIPVVVVLAAAQVATYMRRPTDPSRLKFGRVKTYLCNLDGSVDYSVTKANKMIPVKDHLYQKMMIQYDQNCHCLVPIKHYYDLILIPENEELLSDNILRTNVLSLCEMLDKRILEFSSKIVKLSIKQPRFRSQRARFKVLLASGGKFEIRIKFEKYINYSLLLSHRTNLNQLYHELIQTSRLPNLLNFARKHSLEQLSIYDEHIQRLFGEYVKWFELKGLDENAKIVRQALDLDLNVNST